MLVCKRHRGVAPVLQLRFQISQIRANQVSISLDGSWVSGIYQSVPTSLDLLVLDISHLLNVSSQDSPEPCSQT